MKHILRFGIIITAAANTLGGLVIPFLWPDYGSRFDHIKLFFGLETRIYDEKFSYAAQYFLGSVANIALIVLAVVAVIDMLTSLGKKPPTVGGQTGPGYAVPGGGVIGQTAPGYSAPPGAGQWYQGPGPGQQ